MTIGQIPKGGVGFETFLILKGLRKDEVVLRVRRKKKNSVVGM